MNEAISFSVLALFNNRYCLLTVPLYLFFSTFVVYLSQRLVEQAAISLEPLERKTAFLRTSICIGCLVWSLDAAGYFMYPSVVSREPRLTLIVPALLVMVVGSILSIPALTNTRRRFVVAAASLFLVLGMLTGHLLLLLSFGTLTGDVSWSAVLTSIVIAVSLAVILSLRHRSERLRAFHGGFRPLSLWENLLAGVIIIPLHMCLVSSFPIAIADNKTGGHGEVLLAFIGFGASVAVMQLYAVKVEAARRKLMNQAHARLRTLPNNPGMIVGQQLSLIAERLPALLVPHRLQLHFQPIVPVAETEGKVRFEALLRVEDHQLGRINPEMFMLACARVRLQDVVDRMIIRRALELSHKWSSQTSRCAGISANVSPETLTSAGFVSWVRDELGRYRLPADWLKLEITEHTMVATNEEIAQIIVKLRDLGVGIILDDFGTGFSSLGVITSLPIEGMKIDRSLTLNLEKSRSNQILLRHLTALGKDLGLKVTVEGVETMEQLAIICKQDVDAIQGWVFAKALPPNSVIEWLNNRPQSGECTSSLEPVVRRWMGEIQGEKPLYAMK